MFEQEKINSTLTVSDEEFTETDLSSIKSIPSDIRRALLEKYSFRFATRVQWEIMRRMPIKNDLRVQSSTGSGKTLAYLIPSFEIMMRCLSPEEISKGKQVSILILAPTRELVLQISIEAKKLLRYTPFNVMSFIGGTSRKEDLNHTISKRVDVIIATPGRVVDLLTSSVTFRNQLEGLKVLVLDEADELLNQGFSKNVLTVLRNIPSTRQTMLFSATMPPSLEEGITKAALRYPGCTLTINTSSSNSPSSLAQQLPIDQKVAVVSHNMQLHLLFGILRQARSEKSIVFLPTVLAVQIFTGLFKELGFSVWEMHSLLDQATRVSVATRFREASRGILISTDVSARGMDYPDVSLVVQWGVPISFDAYLHRIGRTGRAGRPGRSILITSPLEETFVTLLRQKGIKCSMLVIEKDIEKPPSEEIHSINMLCAKLRPGLTRQLFRTTLTHCKYIFLNLNMTY